MIAENGGLKRHDMAFREHLFRKTIVAAVNYSFRETHGCLRDAYNRPHDLKSRCPVLAAILAIMTEEIDPELHLPNINDLLDKVRSQRYPKPVGSPT